MNKNIRVGISVGDLNGIGLEVILKTFSDSRMMEFCTPVIFGSAKLLSFQKKVLNIDTPFTGIDSPADMVEGKINLVHTWKEAVNIEFGKPTEQSGSYAFKSLEAATDALMANQVDVLVTAPINKNNIQSGEFDFPGHTEYLAKRMQGDPLMFLVTEELKVGVATGHIPISEVSKAVDKKLLYSKINKIHESLVRDFAIRKPKIAVMGLNPHNGDGGVIGNEDDKVVRPVVEELFDSGKLVFGPYAADSFFGSDNSQNFDAILGMYHDQGLIPFKTLSFGQGVNFTAGLSEVRTSPDHGTAYEIAGKGLANEQSFREAVFTAIQIFRNRQQHSELTENVLEKVQVSVPSTPQTEKDEELSEEDVK